MTEQFNDLTEQERLLCQLHGQVDALTKTLMTIFLAIPGSDLAAKALASDSEALLKRPNQTEGEKEYAVGFARVPATFGAGAELLDTVAGAELSKKLGKQH